MRHEEQLTEIYDAIQSNGETFKAFVDNYKGDRVMLTEMSSALQQVSYLDRCTRSNLS